MYNFDLSTLGLLTLLAQVILPVIVAVVTRAHASAAVKSVTLLALTAVAQFVALWVDNFNDFNWKNVAFNVLVGFLVSVVMHFGLWKPVGVTGTEGSASKIGA